MAKEIAFQQACGHSGAVHLHHAAAVTVAEVVDRTGNQLFTGAGFTEDQHRIVTLRHHLHLFQHAVHGIAAADDFAKLAVHVIELFRQRQVFIHQPFFQTVDLLIGQRVIQCDGDTLGNLAQQFQVDGGKDALFTLRQLQDTKHSIAGHQR